MVEFVTRNHGGRDFEIIIKTDDYNNYLTAQEYARRLVDGKRIDLTPERCAELAQADKDGRLVVLPCEVGDTVFLIYQARIIECTVEFVNIVVVSGNRVVACTLTCRSDQYGVIFGAFGKTAFLSREESEQALKEAKVDG